jgi:NADPH-dependent 2,4-dienoyl-CoA reductase/sulfur reductase-like enzyme
LACHLREKGFGVTIVEKEPKLASRMFDLQTSRVVEKILKGGRIRVEIGVEVTEVLQERGWVSGARLKDGRLVPCQRIIQAVGVKPNIAFLKGSGIEVDGGILANERMETNVPAVFAAGDVAMTTDPATSKRVNNATWPAAARRARGRHQYGEENGSIIIIY